MSDLTPIKADLTDSVNKAVSNLTDSATKEIGETIGDIWFLVFGGIHQTAAKRKLKYAYQLECFKEELQAEVRKIPEDKRIEPDLLIIGPALELAKYCAEHEVIRSMFAKLISASINLEKIDFVHPSFCETINMMSSLDAKVFKLLCEKKHRPMISLIRYFGEFEMAQVRVFEHITFIDIASYKEVAISLSNLERYDLISLEENSSYGDDRVYDIIRSNQKYIDFCKNLLSDRYSLLDNDLREEKKLITITDYGSDFYTVCVK